MIYNKKKHLKSVHEQIVRIEMQFPENKSGVMSKFYDWKEIIPTILIEETKHHQNKYIPTYQGLYNIRRKWEKIK